MIKYKFIVSVCVRVCMHINAYIPCSLTLPMLMGTEVGSIT